MTCRPAVVGAVFLMALASGARAQPQYTVTEVRFGSEVVAAHRLSDAGHVVGRKSMSESFRWQNGAATALQGFFGGAGAFVRHVNSAGIGVGIAPDPGTATSNAAAMWDSAGQIHDLGHLGDMNASAADINDSNWIVGSADPPQSPDETHPFLWRNGSMIDLGTVYSAPFGVKSHALAINESGSVIGWQSTSEGTLATPWIWTETGGLKTLLPYASYWGRADDINDAGEVLINRALPSDMIGVWSGGQIVRELGPGYGFAINNDGWVVGVSEQLGGDIQSLWIDTTRYSITDLLVPGSGYTITNVRDINNAGQILAVGYRNGVGNSLLLTPVPEPASIVALIVGAALVLRRRRSSN